MKRMIYVKRVTTWNGVEFTPYYADPKHEFTFNTVRKDLESKLEAHVLSNIGRFSSSVKLPIVDNEATREGCSGLISDDGADQVLMGGYFPPDIKVGSSNQPQYNLSKTSGDIVVQPLYKRRKAKFLFSPGKSVTNEEFVGSVVYAGQATGAFSKVKFPSNEDLRPGEHQYVLIDLGPDKFGDVEGRNDYYVGDVEENVHPYSVGLSEQMLAAMCEPALPSPDPAWVQESIAESNKKTLDWLTAVAELPETIHSIIGALSTLRDVLHRSDAMGERIRREHKEYLKNLRKKIEDVVNMLSKAKLKTIRNRLTRTLRKLNRELSREGKSLIDKLTSAWMAFRYEIVPLVGTIKDGIEAWHIKGQTYFTTRDRHVQSFNPILPSNWTFQGTCEFTDRIMIKNRHKLSSDDLLSQLNKVLSGNIALTAWELVSRSFVADWFLTVGDFISAAFGNPASKDVQRASTLSRKLTISGLLIEKTTKAQVDVDISTYVRLEPNLGSFTGLYFRPDWSLKRQIDTFCLAWPTLRKQIR